jgi:hypothetical protein
VLRIRPLRVSTSQGHPGALACDSVERASAVFRSDGFLKNSVGFLTHLTKQSVQILMGAQQILLTVARKAARLVFLLLVARESESEEEVQERRDADTLTTCQNNLPKGIYPFSPEK